MEIEDERGQEGTAGTAVAEPTATTVESECADVEEGEEEEPFYQPTDIAFKSMVFDTQFHPTQNIIAAGLVSGFVKL